jgi:hypothetical protein
VTCERTHIDYLHRICLVLHSESSASPDSLNLHPFFLTVGRDKMIAQKESSSSTAREVPESQLHEKDVDGLSDD